MSEFKESQVKIPSPQERLDLVLKVLAQVKTTTELANEAGISRTLMYRWLGKVRTAAMQALESEDPGPKGPKGDEAEKELQKAREELQKAQKELTRMAKENSRLQEVERVSKAIIKRQGWGPHPDDAKKNGEAKKHRGRPRLNRNTSTGASSEPQGTPASGEYTGQPSGAGNGLDPSPRPPLEGN
jgi:transposase-like protein